jgi:hypothetical protein
VTNRTWLAALFRSFTKKAGWVGGVIALIGIAASILDVASAPTKYVHVAPTADDPSGVVNTAGIVGWRAAGLILGIFVVVFGFYLLSGWVGLRSGNAEKRAAQIKRLTEALDEALTTIGSIQFEVEEGQRVLAQIQRDIVTNKDLAELTVDQSKAVEELVRKELKRERLPALWIQILVGIALFAFGALLSHL